MELALILLAVARGCWRAAILAFALRKPAGAEPPPPDPRLDTVLAGQGDIAGQFSQTVAAQASSRRTLAERLEALDKRLGENLTDSATKTAATIAGIGERLTVIDEAQKNISALSGQVVSACSRSCPTSSRAAPSARRRWKRSCATACRPRSTISSSPSPTATGPIASSAFPATRRCW